MSTVETLQTLIPDVEVLLALAPEELALTLLKLAKRRLQNGIFDPNQVVQITSGFGATATRHLPYEAREGEVQLALSEAWNWLRVQSLIVPAPGINGSLVSWSLVVAAGRSMTMRPLIGFEPPRLFLNPCFILPLLTRCG